MTAETRHQTDQLHRVHRAPAAAVLLPPGSVVASVFSVTTMPDRIRETIDGRPPTAWWNFRLTVPPEDGAVLRALRPVQYIEIYAVRHNGVIVRHLPVAEPGQRYYLHRAESVFRVLGSGGVVMLCIFSNVTNNRLLGPPKKYASIPCWVVPGALVVVLHYGQAETDRRYVFFNCPPEWDAIWETRQNRYTNWKSRS